MLCPLLVALHTITWSLAILRGLATEWHISNYAIEVRFDYKDTVGVARQDVKSKWRQGMIAETCRSRSYGLSTSQLGNLV